MICSNCGSDNKNDAKFCVNCGKKVEIDKVALEAQKTAYRPMKSSTNSPITHTSEKNPLLALLFSFLIAGGGQFYNGDTQKGGLMLGAAIVGGFLTAGFITVGIWIWSMIDAYNTAKTPKEPIF